MTLERTALELSGKPGVGGLRGLEEPSQSIACSRCFGEPVEDFESLAQSVAYYLGRAAEKLRAQGQRAGGAGAYFVYYPERSPRRLDGGAVSANIVFSRPTDDTSEMIRAVFPKLREIFIAGRRYKKSGVTLWGLESGAGAGGAFRPSPGAAGSISVDRGQQKIREGNPLPACGGRGQKVERAQGHAEQGLYYFLGRYNFRKMTFGRNWKLLYGNLKET